MEELHQFIRHTVYNGLLNVVYVNRDNRNVMVDEFLRLGFVFVDNPVDFSKSIKIEAKICADVSGVKDLSEWKNIAKQFQEDEIVVNGIRKNLRDLNLTVYFLINEEYLRNPDSSLLNKFGMAFSASQNTN